MSKDPYAMPNSRHQFEIGKHDSTFADKCCAKRTYATRKEAKRFAALSEANGALVKPYRCPYCGLYHLTHRFKEAR